MPPPSAPVIQSRPQTADSTIIFWWGPPVNNGGHPIQFYRFFDGTTFTDVPPNGSPYTVTGVPNGVDLSYLISASNGFEFSPFVPFQTVQAGSRPSAPQSITSLAGPPGIVTLSWKPPASNGGAVLRWYVATATPVTGGQAQKFSLLGSSTAGTLAGLDPTKSYRVLLQAVNDPGYSPNTSFGQTVTWGFQPRDLEKLSLWLDASDPTTLLNSSGTTVYADTTNACISSCLNKAQGGRPFQPDGPCPSFSLTAIGFIAPAIKFERTRLVGSFSSSQNEKTVFLVFSAKSGQVVQTLNGLLSISVDTSSNLLVTADCPALQVPLFRTGNPILLRILIGKTTVNAKILSPPTDSEVSAPRNGHPLGDLGPLCIGGGDCCVSEVLMYDSVVSLEDADRIKTYLVQKWALSKNPLPPQFSILTDRSTVSQYGVVSLMAQNTGGSYIYVSDTWAFNDILLSENTHGSYSFHPSRIGVSEVEYSVQTETETYLSAPFWLTVLPLIGTSSISVPAGSPVDLLVNVAANSDYLSDTWYLNGAVIATGTRGKLLNHTLASPGVVTFTYDFVNLKGEVFTSVPVFIQVN